MAKFTSRDFYAGRLKVKPPGTVENTYSHKHTDGTVTTLKGMPKVLTRQGMAELCLLQPSPEIKAKQAKDVIEDEGGTGKQASIVSREAAAYAMLLVGKDVPEPDDMPKLPDVSEERELLDADLAAKAQNARNARERATAAANGQ